jgi:hypothetical protein
MSNRADTSCQDTIQHSSGLRLDCECPSGHDGDHGRDGYQWDDNGFVWHMDSPGITPEGFTRSYGWARTSA